MNTILKLLEPLIGQQVHIGEHRATVIEIHDDPPALILRAENSPDAFQVDYLGRPRSMAQPTWTQPITADSGRSLHPDLQRQLPLETARALDDFIKSQHS
ncbi:MULTISPECIES: hypothetical protein [unclassified Guyparkeria]|uniref:hypothetical protein n=1 Tax=unclassified Guyparkeria TaxID=2626246 RepID=UPI0007334A38|nr:MULTISPECIES: hypothetical protein [unclassified Guyparkeria]KTG17591.1 hypothetical protein AUR63_08035 [Guyparkeria sp. XI15]OAE88404.1 hypothetical protein AWR35_08050 [Guyparkeria sp. WRN-7]